MKFSKDYSKLSSLENEFTTIRKRTRFYQAGQTIKITTPTQQFKGQVIFRMPIDKSFITPELAFSDADCTRQELIKMLEKWYGKDFDDFVLLKIRRI